MRGYQKLERSQFMRQSREWLKLSLKKIEDLPGLEKKRADTVAVGAVLIESLFRLLKTRCIWVSDKGIREGIILDYIARALLSRRESRPAFQVQWFGQKPYFAGRVVFK